MGGGGAVAKPTVSNRSDVSMEEEKQNNCCDSIESDETLVDGFERYCLGEAGSNKQFLRKKHN